jgi:hypothetical protein
VRASMQSFAVGLVGAVHSATLVEPPVARSGPRAQMSATPLSALLPGRSLSRLMPLYGIVILPLHSTAPGLGVSAVDSDGAGDG